MCVQVNGVEVADLRPGRFVCVFVCVCVRARAGVFVLARVVGRSPPVCVYVRARVFGVCACRRVSLSPWGPAILPHPAIHPQPAVPTQPFVPTCM